MAREFEPLISQYSHLKDKRRQDEALRTLQKVASLVKPIMRAHNWRVGTLAEFFPPESNLLGLNVNGGEKIFLRLRHAGDENQFVGMEQVVDTMLHELSHIAFGPHDANFHKQWNELRAEHAGLINKGYTGEGFLSDGKVLGGSGRIPLTEAQRLTRIAAENQRDFNKHSGQRLGGAPPIPGPQKRRDLRKLMAEAAEARSRGITKGCASDIRDEKATRRIAQQAEIGSFKTKAAEDEANEIAIWEAYRELNGDIVDDFSNLDTVSSLPSDSTLSYGDASPKRYPPRISAPPTIDSKTLSPSSNAIWECPICTLQNPADFLCCDACTTERPESVTLSMVSNTAPPRTGEGSNEKVSTSSGPAWPKDISRSQTDTKIGAKRPVAIFEVPKPRNWCCLSCGMTMEAQWWTCSRCGQMKTRS